METIVMIAQLLLGLSILVGLHEFGHFITAKFFGMRVEQFSIGFPPRLFGFKKGETDFSIGAIPLGGFVKISGMIDESLDTKKLSEEPKEYEFRAKPAWQRLIVMMGGIIVNVITGIVIFVIMAYALGESYIPREELNKHGIVAYQLGEEIGLKTGDKILKVNGQEYERFSDLRSIDVLMESTSYYTVQRGQETLDIHIPRGFLDRLSDKDAINNFIDFRSPFEVAQVMPNSAAQSAGLEAGDRILKVNDLSITYFDEFQEALEVKKGEAIELLVQRNGEEKTLNAKVTDEGTLGFAVQRNVDYATRQFGFIESLGKGTHDAFAIVWVNIRALGKIFSGEVSASKSVSGPIGIAQIFGGTWNWYNFWRITGLLSMILAFMNFLPIPALDGGHVAFLTFEIVSGRKPSDKFLENAQKVGMVLLLAIMTFAIGNDIFKLIF